MEERKVDELIQKFDAYMLTIDNNEKASREFLQNAGILDENGKLEKPYQDFDLCTHQGQD